MLSWTMAKTRKSPDVTSTQKKLPLTLTPTRLPSLKRWKSDCHLPQLTVWSQSSHQPEDIWEEWKSKSISRKTEVKKPHLTSWVSFQVPKQPRPNQRRSRTTQFFLQTLNLWTQTQSKSSTTCLHLLTRKNCCAFWSRSHSRIKAARRLSEWWLFPLMLRTMRHCRSERRGTCWLII